MWRESNVVLQSRACEFVDMYDRILVPTDGSDGARTVAREALTSLPQSVPTSTYCQRLTPYIEGTER